MSDSLSAYRDRMNDRIYNNELNKLASLTHEQIYHYMKDIRMELQYLSDSDIALTRGQWQCMNRLQQVVKEMIGG